MSPSIAFIGGGQIGYNYDFKNQIVAGLEADIDGLTQSNSNASVNSVALVDFPENYTSTFSATKHVDYLGTVRGRLGYLFNPTLLLFGTGGFAYGGVSFNPSFTANESLGAATYPPVIVHNKIGQTRTGWTAGAGGEWMFRPNLTAKLEYTYYDLGTANSNVVLSQINNDGIPPVLWGTANVYPMLISFRFYAPIIWKFLANNVLNLSLYWAMFSKNCMTTTLKSANFS